MKTAHTLWHHFSTLTVVALCTLGAVLIAASATPAQAASALGDSQVFAAVPTPPGFPEGIAVDGNRVYVCGPAINGNLLPSKVLAYDLKTGALVQEYPIQGQDFTREHALSGCAFARDKNKPILYVVDIQQGIIRFDPKLPLGPQEVYATPLPDLPTCLSVPPGTPCSPTTLDRPPLPNDLVFAKDGNAYLSDSFQATIWRIPPGGGAPQIWFQDPRLDTVFIGPNGLRIDKQTLYLAVSLDAVGQGFIYTLPVVAQPLAADLTVFHDYGFVGGPDGIAFGQSGKLYVALALTSQISVLRPDGTEETRYSGPATDPNNPLLPVPWTNPANIAFDNKNRSLLVTNHAILMPLPPLFVVFDVFVDDKGEPLAKPKLP